MLNLHSVYVLVSSFQDGRTGTAKTLMIDKGSWCFGTGAVHVLGMCGVVDVGWRVVGMSLVQDYYRAVRRWGKKRQ
jgi:hypothetical protein